MTNVLTANPSVSREENFDQVGRYNQDAINGLSDKLLHDFLSAAKLDASHVVLDCMAGDGNLTRRMLEHCQQYGNTPKDITILEYSRVQASFAEAEFVDKNIEVICGDVISMVNRDTGEKLPDNHFDRIFIKSANHEIPLALQEQMHSSLLRCLKPGGLLINLGFLYEDSQERDELREIARVKDRLGGMEEAVKNRHFLTREEYYGVLKSAGFEEAKPAVDFKYHIKSTDVAKYYFTGGIGSKADKDFQASQIVSFHMREKGCLEFSPAGSVMHCPGEVTVSRKASLGEKNGKIFTDYPYDYLRHIECHRELLANVVEEISPGDRVLDLACGLSLLGERLTDVVSSYHGVDLFADFIKTCQSRFQEFKQFSFENGDLNSIELNGKADVVAILNALYIPAVDHYAVLKKAFAALEEGGLVIVSGPLHKRSFKDAWPQMCQQIKRDDLWEKHKKVWEDIELANESLLGADSNYWSIEGMAALLTEVGFTVVSADDSYYYNNAFVVKAVK